MDTETIPRSQWNPISCVPPALSCACVHSESKRGRRGRGRGECLADMGYKNTLKYSSCDRMFDSDIPSNLSQITLHTHTGDRELFFGCTAFCPGNICSVTAVIWNSRLTGAAHNRDASQVNHHLELLTCPTAIRSVCHFQDASPAKCFRPGTNDCGCVKCAADRQGVHCRSMWPLSVCVYPVFACFLALSAHYIVTWHSTFFFLTLIPLVELRRRLSTV